ncbi:MAG: helix-turn-helix domain-containing protein [Bacillota bacterium]
MLDNLIGVEEAAKLWGLSPGYIKNLCADGRIIAKKIGNTWVIDKTQDNPKRK